MYAEDTTDGTINFASINTGANGAIEFANEKATIVVQKRGVSTI